MSRRISRQSLVPNQVVGRTIASVMGEVGLDKILTRSAEKLITLVTERSCSMSALAISASTKLLVRSLIIPIVCRRSLREQWFSDKELGKFVRSMSFTAARIHSLVDESSREQAYIKYFQMSYMCKIYEDDNLPVREDWMYPNLFCGWVSRFIARRLAKRDVQFFYSLDKGARQSWPPMSKEKEAKVLLSHELKMGRADEPSPKDSLRNIIKVSTRLLTRPPLPTKFLPTGSACLQASVKDGGALSLFVRFRYPTTEQDRAVGSLRALNMSLVHWRISNWNFSRENTFIDFQDMVPEELVEGDKQSYHPLALEVDIVPLPEPGKFRIISKGNGYLYSYLQPLQGQMLSCWKRSKFSTMLESDLTARVQDLDDPELPLWCSGDYESATDWIRKHPSMVIFKVLENLSGYMTESVLIGAASFAYARAVYPDGHEVDLWEGQLMGHVLSFVILCLVNLGAYMTAIERWEAAAPLSRRTLARRMRNKVIINGDDILFKCQRSFMPYFYVSALDVGLRASQGKNYLSRDMCTINSQVFRRIDGRMKRFSYLNQRFLYGKGQFRKASSDTDVTIPTQLSRGVNEMCDYVPWTRCLIPLCMKRFDDHWFGNFLRSPNWYLPVHLGGLGFEPRFGPETNRISTAQKIVAAMFVHDPAMAIYRLKGVDIPTAKYYGAVAKVRMVPSGIYVPEEHEEESLSDEWLARLAYASRAHHGVVKVNDKVFMTKFKRDPRLKPMNLETIERYRTVRFFQTKLPSCPPLNFFI